MYYSPDIRFIVITTIFFLLTFFVSLKSKSYKDASTFMIVMFMVHCFAIAILYTLEQTTFKLAYTIYAFMNLITLIIIKLSSVKRNNSTVN